MSGNHNRNQSSPLVLESAQKEGAEVFLLLQSSDKGLTETEAEARLAQYGFNEVAQEKRDPWFIQLIKTCRNPLDILLLVLSVVSYFTGDLRAAAVIGSMVVISVSLRFVQHYRSDKAVAKLRSMIRVTSTVVRDGEKKEIPLGHLVPGDLIQLSAGDIIPADVRIVAAKDLFINQASLTGEAFPVEKFGNHETNPSKPLLELSNICLMGTNVESGAATAVVVTTGHDTYFGKMARSITGQQILTSFDHGINRFTWLMIRIIMVMAPLVFIINWITKHDWFGALFFALAVAVGLTPEMLPMIITVCLSKGAIAMSRKKVIVKRLNAIQNLGGMDVLCTDKTGTLTLDRVILEKHCDVVRNESEVVLRLAYLNSYFQTGLKNVLDRAILKYQEVAVTNCVKVDEAPFDFSRKIMSVVVDMEDGNRKLIAKGAPSEILKRCNQFELDGEILPLEYILVADLRQEYDQLGSDGFRVLALAYKDMERKAAYSKEDEKDLILAGYVAFLDPPKDTAAQAISALQKYGVKVKVLTGDNELVTHKICKEVGLSVDTPLLGADIEKMSDEQLAEAVEKTVVFARLSPSHKQRIIQTLRNNKHVVGFLGDGINDAPALRAADVGISVDTAVDIAKESADIILLEKSLMVLEEGVLEGRKVFANILKYIKMGASSNFGNMFSVLGASAFLPFLPMKPLQILTNNLLYDVSQVAIPTDNVDQEFIAQPRPWATDKIKKFILFIGPISSIFDYATYFLMLYVFNCWNPANESLFQTGWFVESLLTQTLIIHVIRTNKIPWIQSRGSWPLTMTSLVIMAVGIALPFSPIANSLGFVHLPSLYWPFLMLMLLGYIILTQIVKFRLVRKSWV